ncbi:CMGC SRPK kinase [Lecanosticta acicola]|uniref:CMGC SRPK kinase n=1 Tax=Lecanosticta acicola TaxID=111012 RepID=A0AAI8YY36_9PEZI|nr:CMGC SRPK kinase [Lecanosticta acicola]
MVATAVLSPTLLVPSLNDLYNVPGMGYAAGARRLRAELVKRVNAQVVEAVEFLHDNGIVHGVKSIDQWTEEEVYRQLGDPVKEEVRTTSEAEPGMSAPRYIVGPTSIPPTDFRTSDIYLVDFGESFRGEEPPRIENIGLPFMYRAPETIFTPQYNQNSEIWALACLLFEIRAGNPFFTSIMGGADEILQQMVQQKGKLPEPWWH